MKKCSTCVSISLFKNRVIFPNPNGRKNYYVHLPLPYSSSFHSWCIARKSAMKENTLDLFLFLDTGKKYPSPLPKSRKTKGRKHFSISTFLARQALVFLYVLSYLVGGAVLPHFLFFPRTKVLTGLTVNTNSKRKKCWQTKASKKRKDCS